MKAPRIETDAGALRARRDALPGVDTVRETASSSSPHLVGGAVRDLLLGRERGDVDIVVDGDAVAVARHLGGEVTVHERFGTATVRLQGHTLDLTTARAESYPHPGALPEVRPGTLIEDLARRDFTVNAMALPLVGEPSLVDPHGGARDLAAGVLRVLHPRSFVDDPTRALRAARYAGRLGLELEPDTAELLVRVDLGTVSAERARAELRKLALEPAPLAGLELATHWGLIGLDGGELELMRGFLELLDREPWVGVADRGDAVLALASGGSDEARALATERPERPSAAVAAAHGHSGVELALARCLGAEWLDSYVADWRHVRLEIGGEELMDAGVPQGPAVGQGLEAALRAKLDGEVAGRAAELEVALAAARGSGAG